MIKFKINEIITLRLENEKTNIYINGELFEQCSYILLNTKVGNLEEFKDINSVDELRELSIDEIMRRPNVTNEEDSELEVIDIPAHVRFLVHCSNIQAWVEHDYDTRLLHSNLSFPLLKKLSEIGDLKALQKFKEEIISRFFNGTKNVQKYLLQEGYIKWITGEEKFSLFKLEGEESVIKELEKLTRKEFYMDSEVFHYDQSFVLKDGKVKELNLTRCNITKLPKIIKELKNLNVLRIVYNSLNHIPDWIGELDTLKILRICQNLEEIPESIGNLKLLEELNLSGNKLKTIPKSISNLQKLKKLDVANNNLKFLPVSFGNLNKLQKLNINNNEIKSLPELFGNLNSLEELNISKNKLKDLPESFGKLDSLKTINFYKNRIKQLPDSLGNLKSIRILNLGKNLLEEIPTSIGNLKTLMSLNIGSNKLSTLPLSIGNLTSLERLDCRRNQLVKLPESICKQKKLKDLFLQNNKISALPSCIGRVRTLELISLNENPIKHLPATITNLDSLKGLYIEGTQISESEIEWLKIKFSKWTVHTNKYEFRHTPWIYCSRGC